jgi:hypothetical protein
VFIVEADGFSQARIDSVQSHEHHGDRLGAGRSGRGPASDKRIAGEAEETALFLPVMRQVFAQSQQPARGQRVGLTAREERTHDFRAEINPGHDDLRPST